MNRVVRSLIAGSLVGAAVGLVMLANRRRGMMDTGQIDDRARGTVKMVRDNAMRWGSAMKNGTEAFSRKLARRNS